MARLTTATDRVSRSSVIGWNSGDRTTLAEVGLFRHLI